MHVKNRSLCQLIIIRPIYLMTCVLQTQREADPQVPSTNMGSFQHSEAVGWEKPLLSAALKLWSCRLVLNQRSHGVCLFSSAGEHITKTINCSGSRPTLTGRDRRTLPANIQPIKHHPLVENERARRLQRCHWPGPRDQQSVRILVSHKLTRTRSCDNVFSTHEPFDLLISFAAAFYPFKVNH